MVSTTRKLLKSCMIQYKPSGEWLRCVHEFSDDYRQLVARLLLMLLQTLDKQCCISARNTLNSKNHCRNTFCWCVIQSHRGAKSEILIISFVCRWQVFQNLVTYSFHMQAQWRGVDPLPGLNFFICQVWQPTAQHTRSWACM